MIDQLSTDDEQDSVQWSVRSYMSEPTYTQMSNAYRQRVKEDRRKAFPAVLPDKKLKQIKGNVHKAAENIKQKDRRAKVTVDTIQKQIELIEQP